MAGTIAKATAGRVLRLGASDLGARRGLPRHARRRARAARPDRRLRRRGARPPQPAHPRGVARAGGRARARGSRRRRGDGAPARGAAAAGEARRDGRGRGRDRAPDGAARDRAGRASSRSTAPITAPGCSRSRRRASSGSASRSQPWLPGPVHRRAYGEDPGPLPEDAGCVIVEPVQGRAGSRVPPDGFLETLRRRCDEAGALLVVDSIFAGLGRVGEMWPGEEVADVLCVGKALGGGLPLSAALFYRDGLEERLAARARGRLHAHARRQPARVRRGPRGARRGAEAARPRARGGRALRAGRLARARAAPRAQATRTRRCARRLVVPAGLDGS